MVEMLTVPKSSNVHSIGYENKTLYVRYRNSDHIYKYFDVSEDEVRKILNATSVGKVVHEIAKKHRWE